MGAPELASVSHASDGLVEIVEIGFALKVELMIEVEKGERKRSLRSQVTCRIPAEAHKLGPLRNVAFLALGTSTKCNVDNMVGGEVVYDEVLLAYGAFGACFTIMAEVNA